MHVRRELGDEAGEGLVDLGELVGIPAGQWATLRGAEKELKVTKITPMDSFVPTNMWPQV